MVKYIRVKRRCNPVEQSCYQEVRKTKATARQDKVMKEGEGCPPLSSDNRTKEIYDGDSKVTFNTILSLVLLYLL